MSRIKKSAPAVSLVVIVRDQADDLARLLDWHRALYNHAIVVDTGSADQSCEVALAAGAELLRFQWRDDFSAARNAGLERVRGRWALVLDCDERIAAADFEAIRLLARGADAGWEFRQRNYCLTCADPAWVPLTAAAILAPSGAQGYIDTPTCRLFPAQAGVRYQGVVHEMPNASLERARIAVSPSEIVVHHDGHMINTKLRDKKTALYGTMLRNKLKRTPSDPLARYELAVQLVTEGRELLASRLLARTISEAPEHAASHKARLLLGRLLLLRGRKSAGLRQFEAAAREWPTLRESWTGATRAFMLAAKPDRARAYLQQGRYLFPRDESLRAMARELQGELVAPGADTD